MHLLVLLFVCYTNTRVAYMLDMGIIHEAGLYREYMRMDVNLSTAWNPEQGPYQMHLWEVKNSLGNTERVFLFSLKGLQPLTQGVPTI